MIAKFRRAIDWSIRILIASMFFYVSYSLADTRPPVENITYKTAREGGNLVVVWNQGRVNRTCAGIAQRHLETVVDEVRYTITLPDIKFSKITKSDKFPVFNKKWAISVNLDHTFPSNWEYHVFVKYACNPIQKMYPFGVAWPVVEFSL
jgi:hypothetical protein